MRTGVIDVGTNSVRVLVADVADGGIKDLARELTITRLGEGVDRAHALGAEPLRRTIEAIEGYARTCRELNAERVRIIATSAVRDATNRDEFFDGARAATGLDADLLTGDEEARFGFAGATAGMTAPGPFLVVDIGGGSTEFVAGARAAEHAISIDIGSVRLTERHIANDPPQQGEIEAVRADAATNIARAAQAVGEGAQRTLIGLAGTITTITAVALGLTGYDRDAIHHAVLERSTVEEIRERLCSMTNEQRRALPAMPPGRESVIVAGTIIFEQILDHFGFASCLVSESDILDGTTLDLARAGKSTTQGESL